MRFSSTSCATCDALLNCAPTIISTWLLGAGGWCSSYSLRGRGDALVLLLMPHSCWFLMLLMHLMMQRHMAPHPQLLLHENHAPHAYNALVLLLLLRLLVLLVLLLLVLFTYDSFDALLYVLLLFLLMALVAAGAPPTSGGRRQSEVLLDVLLLLVWHYRWCSP